MALKENGREKKPGFRPHSLVALGSCIFTIIAFQSFYNFLAQGITLNPLPVIQAVAIGIGFLGAGVIFVREDRIEGLTTAAGPWAAAGIGVAVGANFYFLAVVSTFLAILILAGFGLFEEKIINKKLKGE